MKRVLRLIMVIVVALYGMSSSSTIAYAYEDLEVIVHEVYNEITGPQELLEYAVQLYSVSVADACAAGDDIEENVNVTQLLERKLFANGTEERIYATTSFLVVDENNEDASMRQLVKADIVEHDGSTSSAGGNYNLAVACTAYWTWMNDGTSDYARCTHTTNQVVGSTMGQYQVTQLQCAFKATNDGWTEETYIDQVYFNYPVPYEVYTAENPRKDFFYVNRAFAEIAAGVVIHYNDGSTYELYIDVKAAAGNW